MKQCAQCQMRYANDTKFCFVDGSEVVPIPDPRIGSTLAGRYVVEALIGEGGMAQVYRARHKLVDRPCAVKIMNPLLARDPVVRERFRREAKNAQKLAHPNVIEIFDQGDTGDGTAYIVMELLQGSSLAEVIHRGPVPLARATTILLQVARGIARAHDLEVVHRDLKPENIFVCRREDGTDLVKVLDFGIARSGGESRLTGAGELFGTPQYMAPERIASPDAGPPVDLYALGVVAFEVLGGRLPFEAGDVAQLFVKHLKEPPPNLRALNPEVPPALEDLVLRLLAKDPAQRPVDAHRVAQDLLEVAASLGAPLPPDPENDPESSVMPAAPLPQISIDRWDTRTHLFEEMVAAVFSGPPPPDVARVLEEVRGLVVRIRHAKGAGVERQEALEAIQIRGREGRQRFGFAVDALGVDLSRAKDELRSAQARETVAKAAAEAARQAVQSAQAEVLRWEGRSGLQEPLAELADAYRKAAAAVDTWREVELGRRTAARTTEERERTTQDLDYQVLALRSALAQHERTIDADYGAAEAAVIDTNAQVEALEARLLTLATEFCEPLRRRPELRVLFQKLQAEGAA